LWSIQVLRFVAALMVVHTHAVQRAEGITGEAGWLGQVGTFGAAGVDIFFVISGVVIAITARGLTPMEFAGKRVRRILPAYVLLTIPWLFVFSEKTADWRVHLSTWAFWPALDEMVLPFNPVAWSLCYEVLFYTAAGLVLWRPKLLVPLLLTYGAALCIRGDLPALRYLGNPIILEFLAGVALAYAPRVRWAVVGLPIGFAVLILGGLLDWPPHGGPLEFLRGDQGWWRVLLVGLPSVAIVWGTMQIAAQPSALTYLGDASYSLYLVHPLVMWLMHLGLVVFPVSMSADALILIQMAASVLVAWRFYELFEKPILNLLNRRRTASPAVA
jgi:exopolysaccharide production protein ExoZ